MIFKSRTDWLFSIIIWITVIFLSGLLIYTWIHQSGRVSELFWITAVMVATAGLLLWIYFQTLYEISEGYVKYQTGPLTGKIDITSIKEIIVGKTLWSGWKPATARKGLIVKYNKFDEIYFSPESNEEFVKEILKINSEIKIIR